MAPASERMLTIRTLIPLTLLLSFLFGFGWTFGSLFAKDVYPILNPPPPSPLQLVQE